MGARLIIFLFILLCPRFLYSQDFGWTYVYLVKNDKFEYEDFMLIKDCGVVDDKTIRCKNFHYSDTCNPKYKILNITPTSNNDIEKLNTFEKDQKTILLWKTKIENGNVYSERVNYEPEDFIPESIKNKCFKSGEIKK